MKNKTIDGITVKIDGIAWLLQKKDQFLDQQMCNLATAIDEKILSICLDKNKE